MKASLRGYVGWAQQVGSAQQLLLALSRCVWGPGAGRQRSGSFLFVHLLVIVKGLPAPPGPVGDNPAAAPPPAPPQYRTSELQHSLGCLLRPRKHPVQTGCWWRWPLITPRCSVFCSISEATILSGSDVRERGLSRGVMTSRADCSGHPLPVIKGG